jgi:hypothetical protein
LPSLADVRAEYSHEVNAELVYELCAALVREGLGTAEPAYNAVIPSKLAHVERYSHQVTESRKKLKANASATGKWAHQQKVSCTENHDMLAQQIK